MTPYGVSKGQNNDFVSLGLDAESQVTLNADTAQF